MKKYFTSTINSLLFPNHLFKLFKKTVNSFRFGVGFLFLVCLGNIGFGQTTLAVGDISILGFNANTPDNFVFVTWVNLAPNTVIKFTDNGFLSSSSANLTNNGRGGENFVTWTNNTGNTITAGSVVKIENGTGNIASTSLGAVIQTLSGIANGGDQIFAYQGAGAGTTVSNSDFGTNANPSTFTGTILFGLNFPVTWLSTGIASSNTSYLPSELNVSNGNIVIASSSTGGQYTGSRTNQSTMTAYRTLVNNSSNWTVSTGANLTTLSTTFFTLASPTITTTGTLNQVNITYGTASITPTSFTASGSGLTNDILITPPAGYEVSKTAGGASGYAATQTLTHSGGTVASTTIYLRLKADATVAGSPYAGNIVLTSTGATTVNVATISSTVTAKALTISGIIADNKVYDRTTMATLTGTPAYVGLANGETFSVTGTPTASFATASVGTAKSVTVAGYTTPSSNYSLQSTILTANITQKSLTVTGTTAANKVYDGNTTATLNGATLEGIISPDDVSVSGNGTFTSASVVDGISVTASLALGGNDAPNYSLTQPIGLTANITPKSLTITDITADNKIFDGTTAATLSGTPALNGIVSGDGTDVILGGTPTATFTQSAIGNGIAVTVAGYTISGTKAGNYTLTQPTGLTANITEPAPVINSTLTASATYGTAAPVYTITATNSPTSFNATGLPNGLTINTTTGEITGTPTSVTGSPFSVSISATNAGGTGTATLVYTINQKALTITTPTASNKVYDGSNSATITGTLTGRVGSDDVTLNGTGTFSQSTVGTNLVVTSTSTLSGTDASNYSLTQPTELTANIAAKDLSITGLMANNKVFDGTTAATLSGTAGLNGIVSGDGSNVILAGTPTAVFAQSSIGNGIMVTVTGYSITGLGSGNYTVSQPTGLTADITALGTPVINSVLTASATYGVAATTYNITATNSPTSFNATGLPDGLSINTTTGEITGTPTSVAGSPFSVNISASNSSGVGTATLIYTINKKELTVSLPLGVNKVYDGNNSATITGTLTGVVGLDVVTLIGTGTFAQSNVGNGIVVTSNSTLGGTNTSNYVLTQPTGLTANISVKNLTVTNAVADNKVYDANETATISGSTLVGVVSPDDVSVSGNGTFASVDVANGIAVITSLTLTGADADNYSLTQPTGLTANILAKPLTINGITANNKVYDRTTAATLTGTPAYVGLVNGETFSVTGTPTASFATASVGTGISVAVSGYTAPSSNYTVSQPTGLTANITAKALTATGAVASNKVYDGNTIATITGSTLSGVINSDIVTITQSGTFAQSNVGDGIVVTSTSILAGANAGNYSLTQPTGLTANITAKPLTISGVTANNKNYDGTTTATLAGVATATLTGIVAGDESNVTLGDTPTATFAQSAVGTAIAVTVTGFTISGSASGNYSLAQPTGLTADIMAKPLTINAIIVDNKVYDGTTAATLTGTPAYVGLVNGETFSVTGTPTVSFATASVSAGKSIIASGYTEPSSNYTVSQPTGLVAEITAKPLTIANPIAQNKVFDGNTNATITGTLTGVISPDVVSLIGIGTFASSAVGNGITVTSTSTLGGAGAGNYTLTQPMGLTANITAPQFTAGNIAVFVATASANNTTANIVELNTVSGSQAGTLFQIPTSGANLLRFSGSATSTGYLANSNDGSLLLFTGANNSTTNVNSNTLNPRGVGTFNPTGIFNLPTTYTGTSGNQTRSSTSLDNTTFFIADQGGIYSNGTTTASPSGNFRGIKSFGGIVYAFTASASLPPVGTISATTGGTFTALPGLTNGATSRQDFYLISSELNGNSFDVLYILDATSQTVGTIFKYSLVSGSWVANGTHTTAFGGFGLASKKAGTGVELFVSTGTGATTANNVIKLTDVAGYNTAINITTANNVTLYTAATGTIVKGVAFSPITPPPTVNLAVSSNTGTEAGTMIITVSAVSTAPVSGEKTISLGVSGINITAGDYILSNSTITIPDGGTTGSVTFTIVDDVIAENTETAILTLRNPSSGVVLGSPIIQNITITDNDNTAPTIIIDVATTSNYVDGGIAVSPASSFATSGVLNDPTDPAKTLGIDFTIGDAETAMGSLTVTATSSTTAILPNANLNLTGSGASRNLKITPNAEGFSTVTVAVNDGISTTSFTINYASSNASINPSITRFHTGTADASTAQMIDNNLMIVADDENQALRMYDRSNSGLPVNSFDFTTSLNLPDISGGTPREVDIEASAKVGNRIYWMGSHSNASSGNNRLNRSRFFATDITGTGNATTLSYVGRYDHLKTELLAWDANNGHGLGANFLGLAASSADGKIPETDDGSGFNIEGFEIAPNNSTAYICFRAPLQTITTRTKALIIPLTNFADLVSGNPTSTTATFGNPIQLDLGGRAIREMKKNASGEYLIIAGPHDGSTGIAPKDFRFYTWTGNPTDAPILRSANLTVLNADGSFESIVDLPSPLVANSNLQILVDNGDAVFYGNGTIAKELPQNNHKKFRSETINLGSAAIAIGTITGTSFCENAPIDVPFTTTETFNSGNIFTAQLSDASGSFVNPVSIGTLSGTSAGTINATIPAGTISGSGYRIRVVSSNSAIMGADNGVNLTINFCTPITTIKSIISGNWESPSTWDLGRIPQAGDLVIIDQNHEVTLNGNGTAKRIQFQGTGKLKMSSSASTLNTGL